eukprot:6464398-Amphidinium_carterae.2
MQSQSRTKRAKIEGTEGVTNLRAKSLRDIKHDFKALHCIFFFGNGSCTLPLIQDETKETQDANKNDQEQKIKTLRSSLKKLRSVCRSSRCVESNKPMAFGI